MKLAQRMVRTFCVNISASNGQLWTALSESSNDTVRITTRKVTETGQLNGVILSAVSTTWLPYSHFQVFDLLIDEQKRSQVLISELSMLSSHLDLVRFLFESCFFIISNCVSFSSLMSFPMGIRCKRLHILRMDHILETAFLFFA